MKKNQTTMNWMIIIIDPKKNGIAKPISELLMIEGYTNAAMAQSPQ
jgi:RNA polymerase subunit RPABC4/transcription elongation factor Spt4